MTEKTENDTEKQADFIKEADEANGIKIVNGVDDDRLLSYIERARLLSYIERVERLEKEKKALSNDIKEVFEEAKYNKIDVSALREILKMRKKDEQERVELDFIVEQYKKALGMC